MHTSFNPSISEVSGSFNVENEFSVLSRVCVCGNVVVCFNFCFGIRATRVIFNVYLLNIYNFGADREDEINCKVVRGVTVFGRQWTINTRSRGLKSLQIIMLTSNWFTKNVVQVWTKRRTVEQMCMQLIRTDQKQLLPMYLYSHHADVSRSLSLSRNGGAGTYLKETETWLINFVRLDVRKYIN